MINKLLNIGVIGFGTTGPAAALYLQKQGHKVTIFERAEECQPVGAGFMLQPSGMMVIDELGLLDPVQRHAAKLTGLHIENRRRNSVLLDLNYDSVLKNGYALGLHRSVLISALLAEVDKYPEIEVHWGVEIGKVDGENGVIIELSGEKHGPYDLVVIADGSNSATRSSLDLDEKVSPYSWGALWWMHPDGKGSFDHSKLNQYVDGTRFLSGFLPTGKAWQESDSPDSYISMFWSVPANLDYKSNLSIDHWKHEVLRLCPNAESFIEPITNLDQLTYASYYDVRMSRWHRQRTIVLGDAAHAMSPQLGQGVNLGLLDAKILSECLAEQKSVEEALQIYSRQRRASLCYYQFATRWLTPFFQSDYELLGGLRDMGFPVMNKIPLLKNQMVATMMGIKGGFLTKHRQVDKAVRALPWG